MADTTGVYVHHSRFPIKILAKLVPANRNPSDKTYVQRLTPLFRYESKVDLASAEGSKGKGKEREQELNGSISSRRSPNNDLGPKVSTGNKEEDKLSSSEILTFESPIEGNVTQWAVEEGTILTDPNQVILRILEPCKHPVQLGGLCAVCGKDLTGIDYTGFTETSRANIQMAHDTSALTVSLEEATRIERQTAERLKQDKKLSLIVDLDQTIIHATVDPTVGDWMHDESNPNHSVLRDVQKFRLLNEVGKEDGCWYYVKPRPALQSFLEEVSKDYEMHVYTMGTRAYAENVCKIIDPDGKFFANRILSRDESGSLSHKSLDRLFPVDQTMVVIIDDRADVWDWSPNLVKVIPYEFFVGIGDINSAFLPKKKSPLPAGISATGPSSSTVPGAAAVSALPLPFVQEETAAAISAQNEELDQQMHEKPLARMQEEKSAALHLEKARHSLASATPSESGESTDSKAEQTRTDKPKPLVHAVSESSDNKKPTPPAASAAPASSALNGIGTSRFITKRVEDTASDSDTSSDDDSDDDSDEEKPEEDGKDHEASPKTVLSDVQEREKAADESLQTEAVLPENTPTTAAPSTVTDLEAEAASSNIDQEEEAVLQDHDTELHRVLDVLQKIHRQFYVGYNSQEYIMTIIPEIKSQVFRGCHFVFSGVIPLDQDPRRSEVWQLARQFGAQCSLNLNNQTTHLIAAKPGTSKVNEARKRKVIKIVTPSWLLDSVNKWSKEPESAHELAFDGNDVAPPASDTPLPFPESPEPDPPDVPLLNDGLEDDELNALDADEEDARLQDIDWGDAEAEINAALDETDDDDDGTFGNLDDVSDAESVASVGSKKRQRGTPSNSTVATESPLAKRRKVAAARIGKSKLKISESIDPVQDSVTGSSSTASESGSLVAANRDDGGTSDGTDDDLDDFAKALEGELS